MQRRWRGRWGQGLTRRRARRPWRARQCLDHDRIVQAGEDRQAVGDQVVVVAQVAADQARRVRDAVQQLPGGITQHQADRGRIAHVGQDLRRHGRGVAPRADRAAASLQWIEVARSSGVPESRIQAEPMLMEILGGAAAEDRADGI